MALELGSCSSETTRLWSLGVGRPALRMDAVYLTRSYPPSVGVMCPGTRLPAADSHWCRSLERPGPVPPFLVLCFPHSAQCQGSTSVLLQYALPLHPPEELGCS